MSDFLALWELKSTQLNKVFKMVAFMLPAFYLNKSSWSVLKFETFIYKIYMNMRKGYVKRCISLFKIISATCHKSFVYLPKHSPSHIISMRLYCFLQSTWQRCSSKLNLILFACLLCVSFYVFYLSDHIPYGNMALYQQKVGSVLHKLLWYFIKVSKDMSK